ncbi:MAG TPA: GspMb/PilO family protein [Candidatus Acidoferrales bacterium]|nr:GspMb/PilO family protein [Candidatus Acidoferrales bacterium]
MNRPIDAVKRWVSRVVAAILLVDAALLAVVWHYSSDHPQADKTYIARLQDQDRRMVADVRRAQAIREQLPDVKKDCNSFLEDTLLRSSTGYSAIVSDLGKVTAEAGLPPGAVAFKQKSADEKGIIEVEVTAVVEGNYASLVKFINGLERSRNLYLIDSLSLASSRETGARLSLAMRTYFRS